VPRKKDERLTPLELEIMQVLWDTGPANVQTVQQRLDASWLYQRTDDAQRAAPQGKVKRHPERKGILLPAAVSRSQATDNAVRDLIDRMFGGSAKAW